MTSIWHSIGAWAEMVKLSHSVFALPFALTAAFLAARNNGESHRPSGGQFVLILVCMVAARSVAMTFNRIVDAPLDARNPRTANRPLPAGRLSRSAAYALLILAAATFGAGCLGFHVFYANTWPMLLSAPILIYLCAYSFTKRFTRWSHFYLGSAVALSPVAAWIAIHPASVGADALLLLIVVTCWIGGFDIIYAFQDIDVDRRDGLHSLPSRLGPVRALWIARSAHVLTVVCLILLGRHARLGMVYAAGVAVVAVVLFVENAMIRPGDYRHAQRAFSLNGIVGLVFGAAAIADILLSSPP